MRTITVTPSIEVAIGRELRLYHAYVTTASARLDAPATITLYSAPLNDVAGMAADPVELDSGRGREPARLVLVDGAELAWQRARYRQAKQLFTPSRPRPRRPRHLAALAVEPHRRTAGRTRIGPRIEQTSTSGPVDETGPILEAHHDRNRKDSDQHRTEPTQQAGRRRTALQRRGTRRAQAHWVRRLEAGPTATA